MQLTLILAVVLIHQEGGIVPLVLDASPFKTKQKQQVDVSDTYSIEPAENKVNPFYETWLGHEG